MISLAPLGYYVHISLLFFLQTTNQAVTNAYSGVDAALLIPALPSDEKDLVRLFYFQAVSESPPQTPSLSSSSSITPVANRPPPSTSPFFHSFEHHTAHHSSSHSQPSHNSNAHQTLFLDLVIYKPSQASRLQVPRLEAQKRIIVASGFRVVSELELSQRQVVQTFSPSFRR